MGDNVINRTSLKSHPWLYYGEFQVHESNCNSVIDSLGYFHSVPLDLYA